MTAGNTALKAALEAFEDDAQYRTLSGRRRAPFEFNGSGAEYFRIWIVNLLLTLATLGVYSAWAKVRRLRYFYGNTVLEGSSFEYHGKPTQILKGRAIAAVAVGANYAVWSYSPAIWLGVLPVMLAMLPWIVVRSRRFHCRMSEYRGVRFGFNGAYRGALGPYLGWLIIASLFAFATPSWKHRRVAYLLGYSSYGNQEFCFTKTEGAWYKFYYLSVVLAIVAFFLAGMLAGFAEPAIAALAAGDFAALEAPSSAALAATIVFVLLAGAGIYAYYTASAVNAAYDELLLGPHRLWCDVAVGKLFTIYLTNALAMIATLGLYYPWARVRLVRYQFESLTINLARPLDDFVNEAGQATDATGEEIGELFAIDFGL